MPLGILLLLGTGISALATNAVMYRTAYENPVDLVPKYNDWDLRKVGLGLGVIGLVAGGPIIAAVSTGVLLGTVLSTQSLGVFKDAILNYRQSQGAPQLPGPAAPQIPGPTAPGPGGFWNMANQMARPWAMDQVAPPPGADGATDALLAP